MLVRNAREIRQDSVEEKGAKGVRVRWLISREDGAPVFAMREFEIEPGGYTPYHSHDWEHEVYVLSGEGVVVGEDGGKPLKPDLVAFVPAGEMHNFKNTGQETFRFLCLVPHTDE